MAAREDKRSLTNPTPPADHTIARVEFPFLGDFERRAFQSLSLIMQTLQADPALRFSETGMLLGERVEQLYLTLNSVPIHNPESDVWIKIGVGLVEIKNSFEKLLGSREKQIQQDSFPLGLLATDRGQRALSGILGAGRDEIAFAYPHQSLTSLAEGAGAFLATVKTASPSEKGRFYIDINEIWDSSKRAAPVLEALFKDKPEIASKIFIHIHFHDDDRFQFIFYVPCENKAEVVRVMSLLAKSALKDETDGTAEEQSTVTGPAYIEEIRRQYPGINLVFQESY